MGFTVSTQYLYIHLLSIIGMANLYKRVISYWSISNKRLEKRTIHFKSKATALNFDVTQWTNNYNINWDSITEPLEVTNLPDIFLIRAISKTQSIIKDSENIEVTSNE